MKLIPLRKGPPLASLEIFRAVLERAPANGLSVGEVRKRCRALDCLAAATDAERLALEDADYDTLKAALEGFAFGMASAELLAIIDDVIEAKAPPPPAAPMEAAAA